MSGQRRPRALGAGRRLRACLAGLIVLAPLAAGPPPRGARGAERIAQGHDQAPVAALFRTHCLQCHDSDGRGGIGRELFGKVPDFTDTTWHASRTDRQLSRAILEGKGKSMPSLKGKLKPAEVTRLVSFLRGFQGGRQVVPEDEPADPPAAAVPKETPRNPYAAALFERSCRNCHGADGRGNALRQRMPTIPDFTSGVWQDRRKRAALEASILEGKGRQMPPFSGSLSRAEVRALVEYIRAFAPGRTDEADDPIDDFDARLRELQSEFDSLRREYRATVPPPRSDQAKRESPGMQPIP